MSDGRIDDEMIEISDPDQEPVVTEPPPKVVIEYRERGVPWMLIPPLLIISVVGGVLIYHKLAPETIQRPTSPPASFSPPLDIATQLNGVEPSQNLDFKSVSPPLKVETPTDPVTTPPVVSPEVVLPPAQPATSVEPSPILEKPAEPATFPKTTGVGFDPKALEADRKADAPPDPALAPAARQDPPREVAKPAIPDERDLPQEVDPDLLPPDPKLAKVRSEKRMVEAVQEVENDRTRFHNDLRELIRIARPDLFAETKLLIEKHGTKVEPKVKQMAINALGENGRFAGVDRPTRIDILRAIGYPETGILIDIYDHYEQGKIGARNGPRNDSEAMYRAILFLLRFAPGQKASPSKNVTARPTPPPPTPATLSNPGNR